MTPGTRVTWLRQLRSRHRVPTPAVVVESDGSFATIEYERDGRTTRTMVRTRDLRPTTHE